MLYASAVSVGVHNLMTMESSPAEVRARRIIAKLNGCARAAGGGPDEHRRSPPKVMAERGVRMFRGASGMLTGDLPLAFAGLSDAALKATLASATATAARASTHSSTWFEKEKLPTANGSFAVGRDNLEARYRAEELIDVPAAQLLAIGERELATNEAGVRGRGGSCGSEAAGARRLGGRAEEPPGARRAGARGAEGRGRTAGVRRREEPGHAALVRARDRGRRAAVRPRAWPRCTRRRRSRRRR